MTSAATVGLLHVPAALMAGNVSALLLHGSGQGLSLVQNLFEEAAVARPQRLACTAVRSSNI